MHIRPATETDYDAIWDIFAEVIAGGDAYVFEDGMTKTDALAYWFSPGTHTYVAEHHGVVVGTYIFRKNQPGRGSHVANGSYMVSSKARGLGVGLAMGEHSLIEARSAGFIAMQFNMVVATNETAVRLWKRLGFEVVGTLPGAFRHKTLGLVDALVMFRKLT